MPCRDRPVSSQQARMWTLGWRLALFLCLGARARAADLITPAVARPDAQKAPTPPLPPQIVPGSVTHEAVTLRWLRDDATGYREPVDGYQVEYRPVYDRGVGRGQEVPWAVANGSDGAALLGHADARLRSREVQVLSVRVDQVPLRSVTPAHKCIPNHVIQVPK
jgi:hypothetical protein